MRSLIARFMGPTWNPPGADRTQVGPMLAPWTLLSGNSAYITAPSPASSINSHNKWWKNFSQTWTLYSDLIISYNMQSSTGSTLEIVQHQICNMKYNINHLLYVPNLFLLEIYSSPLSAESEPHVTINVSKLQGTSNGCLFLALWLDGWFLYWQTHQKQEICVAMHGTALPLGLVVVVAEPQIHFIKGLWAHDPNLKKKPCCSYIKNYR